MKTTIRIFLALGLASASLSSCKKDANDTGLEYMPDMYRSPSYEVYNENPHFADSVSMLKPVEGSIPRNYTFFAYPASNEGYEAAGRDVTNPLPATMVNLAEGKRLYGIYCTPCHGEKGQGDGTLVAIGKFPPPPSYSTGNSSRGGAMKDLSAGKIFHTITYGINLMGAHASQINPEERWKVVQYVQDLQKAGQSAAPADTSANTSTTAAN